MAKIILITACFCIANAMEMRETVERMVMVRRTGSDLQPAATGFIYRSDNNGPASVIKLGESDINEHLDKLPAQPKAYVAPIPIVAALNNKQGNEVKAASYTNEYVIPVVEEEEKSDEGEGFDIYKKDFDDYLAKHYGHHDDDHHYNEHGDGSDYDEAHEAAHGEKGGKGYKSSQEYGKGGAGNYAAEKHESYSITGAGEHKKHYDEADAHGSEYAHGNAYKGGDHGHKSYNSKGEETDGYHKLFNKDEFKKDHDFYDEEGLKGGFFKFGNGHVHNGAESGGHKEGGNHESGHDGAHFGKHGFHKHGVDDVHHKAHSAEDGGESYHHKEADFGAQGAYSDGKGYGYQIKH